MKFLPPELSPTPPDFTLCRACFEGFMAKPGQPGYRELAGAHKCAPTRLKVDGAEHQVMALMLAAARLRASESC